MVLAAPNVYAQDITTGLVGHWTLDETSGSSIADSAGSNTGTWIDGSGDDVTEETGAGQVGTAITFDGTNDRINAGSDASIDNIFVGGGTISAWIYPTGWGGNDFGRVVHKAGSSAGNDGYLFYVDNGVATTEQQTIGFDHGFASGVEGWSAPTNAITLNQWNHVLVTYDNSSDANGVDIAVDEVLGGANGFVAKFNANDVGIHWLKFSDQSLDGFSII